MFSVLNLRNGKSLCSFQRLIFSAVFLPLLCESMIHQQKPTVSGTPVFSSDRIQLQIYLSAVRFPEIVLLRLILPASPVFWLTGRCRKEHCPYHHFPSMQFFLLCSDFCNLVKNFLSKFLVIFCIIIVKTSQYMGGLLI